MYILYSLCHHAHKHSKNLEQKWLKNIVILIAVWDLNWKATVFARNFQLFDGSEKQC